MKKISKWFKSLMALAVLLFILFIFAALLIGLREPNLLNNSVFVNQMAFVLAIMALPGLGMQFFSMIHEDKKVYVSTSVCHYCKQKVDIELREKKD
ncbi:hypothetical protein NYE40_17705 [Paenibacillus sp. FSL W8-1187]|uniref:hypothetical protein n=1 Tax=Paenibacillus sp. FSL W8-1187 TaxID=2975339 RepID=UPI0030DA7507